MAFTLRPKPDTTFDGVKGRSFTIRLDVNPGQLVTHKSRYDGQSSNANPFTHAVATTTQNLVIDWVGTAPGMVTVVEVDGGNTQVLAQEPTQNRGTVLTINPVSGAVTAKKAMAKAAKKKAPAKKSAAKKTVVKKGPAKKGGR